MGRGHGVAKSFVGGIMDMAKTYMFISWRRKMMQGQKPPDLEHGEQSLKDLRLHEQVGAKIVTVEIGDEVTMEALRGELNRLELDFAITEHDGHYTLHYKDVNEQDVLYAQQVALEKLYGGHEQDGPEQDGPEDPDCRGGQDRQDDERDRDEREDRQNDGRREERERGEEEPDQREGQSQDQGDRRDGREQGGRDEQERQSQQDREQRDNGQRDESTPTPIPVPIGAGERQNAENDRAFRGRHARHETTVAAATEQPASTRDRRSTEAPSLAEHMPATPSQSQRTPQK